MTWLDTHVYTIGGNFERRFGRQADGVRSGFARVVEKTMTPFPHEDGPETGRRFEFDLLPYLIPTLMTLSSSLQIDASLEGCLEACRLDAAAERRLDSYFKEVGFTCVHLPSDVFSIGADFEVKSIFVRSATHLERNGVVAPGVSSRYRCYDAIVGRPGEPTRQRLSWRLPGLAVAQACVPPDPDYPGETIMPMAMLHASGMSVESIVSKLTHLALAAVLYELEHRGTPLAVVLPRIASGDEALHRTSPAADRTLASTTHLRRS